MSCWVKDTCKKYLSNQCNENISFCIKNEKLSSLMAMSLLPSNKWKKESLYIDESKADEDVFHYLSEVQNRIEEFVSSGENLYLYSNITGNGKTAWAIRLLQSYINSIWYKCDLSCQALFVSVPSYLLAIKDTISNKNEYADYIKRNILEANLVIWDDIGTKVATSFEHENLLSIIDLRMNSGKSNIFTSNIPPDALHSYAGDRLYSRIINYSVCLCFTGVDKRRLKIYKEKGQPE